MRRENTTRVGDFTAQAVSYARARPGYPGRLVDLLVERVGVGPGDPVADIGAGTGIFTTALAARGLAVTAVEPNEAMRRLADNAAGTVWREGAFESTGLGDGSQRWITSGQAFHWADPPRALPELRRVLSPGGHLSVLWNDRDNEASAILRRTRRLILERVPSFDETYRRRDWAAVLTSTGDFTDPVAHEVAHTVRMTRERYLELWRSHNRLQASAGAQGFAALLREIESMLEAERADVIDVPYRCRAWTVRRG